MSKREREKGGEEGAGVCGVSPRLCASLGAPLYPHHDSPKAHECPISQVRNPALRFSGWWQGWDGARVLWSLGLRPSALGLGPWGSAERADVIRAAGMGTAWYQPPTLQAPSSSLPAAAVCPGPTLGHLHLPPRTPPHTSQ